MLMILGNVEFLLPIFYAVFWQPFWKWQTSRKFWKRRIAPLIKMATTIPQKFNIVHCPISSKFDMWVDNDVPNWFPTLKNFYRSPFPKWPPQNNNTSPDCCQGDVITRYDYNLTIMKFPKPATDNRLKK
jgi:hypothetical protein